jgi:hypothetical protein
MIINQSAKTQALSYLVGNDTTVEALTLRLFSNNATITDTTVAASVTEVTTGDGYTPINLTGSSWAVSVVGNVPTATYPQQTWTFTAPKGNIYGYYITNASGILLLAEKFATGPYNVQTSGDVISVTLSLRLT